MRRPTLDDYDALCKDLGHVPSMEERQRVADAIPYLNALSNREFDEIVAGARSDADRGVWWKRILQSLSTR
jgi:hypothetical protein